MPASGHLRICCSSIMLRLSMVVTLILSCCCTALSESVPNDAGFKSNSSIQSPSFSDDSKALQQFYQHEQDTWREYISRFAEYSMDASFDVEFYHINVDIAINSEYISGDVICLFTVEEADLDEIKLNLQDALQIDSITGNAGSYLHEEDTITIALDRSYSAGESAEVHIYYQGHPPRIGPKGLRYEIEDGAVMIASLSTPYLAHYWWPCKDGPGDKADSVYIDITIPDTLINGIPLIATSNGLLEGDISVGNKRKFQWRERYPIVTYLVMVAISNYVQVDQEYSGPGGVSFPLVYYLFEENLISSIAGLTQFPEVVDFFGELFGPYPFREEKYGITEIGIYGAIENQTNTIQNATNLSWFPITVHEFAHQWFADLITCQDWHHGWVNEGFATYATGLWIEYDQGTDAFQDYMWARQYFDVGSVYLEDTSDPLNIFVVIIYNKGAWVLHMLRRVLGDSEFFDCLYQYSTSPELMYGHATTEDFQSVCETVSDTSLGWFFEQWIYGDNYPEYGYTYHIRPNPHVTEENFETHIMLDQYQTTDPQVFTLPVDFGVWNGLDMEIMSEFNNQRQQHIVLTTEYEPDSITFDPNNSIMDQNWQLPFRLYIITDSITDGVHCETYNDTIDVVCRSDDFTVEIISGSMPPGWALDGGTGVISGMTRAIADSFTFTVKATDNYYPNLTDTATYSVAVVYDPGFTDTDGDGVDDACDICSGHDDLADADSDNIPDGCDECIDSDDDGYGDPGYIGNTCPDDNCPDVHNPGQEDDGDSQGKPDNGIGDACDCCDGRVGDANGLGGDEPTIGDVSTMIDAKFITGTCDGIIECLPEADINQSGGTDPTCGDITIGDISTMVDYLFITGPSLGLPDCL